MAKNKSCLVTLKVDLGSIEVAVEVLANSQKKAFEAACQQLEGLSFKEIYAQYDMSLQGDPEIEMIGYDQDPEDCVEMCDEEDEIPLDND